MYMRDWQFCMILLGVYYQIKNLFPVPHLKNKKYGFALIIAIKNSGGNRLDNVYSSGCRFFYFTGSLLPIGFSISVAHLKNRIKLVLHCVDNRVIEKMKFHEIPCPVSPLKEKSFPLILLGYNGRINRLHIYIWNYMKD